MDGSSITGSSGLLTNNDEQQKLRWLNEANSNRAATRIFSDEKANPAVPVPNDTLLHQILCGYQGWFTYPGDGAPVDKWKHWFTSEHDPSVSNVGVDMYPRMDEYDTDDLRESNMVMKDGITFAKFYSAARPNVVRKHFEWMQEYGISGVFHMRFMQDLHIPKNHDWKTMVLRNVRDAAESTGRVFAVSYNIAGNQIDDSILDECKEDWKRLVDEELITRSDRYIHHRGLPVLRIYGIGFKRVRVSDTAKLAGLIDWLKNGPDERYRVFLIGGVPHRWRDRVGDSREGIEWESVYESLDGIHPWHVGRWKTVDDFGDKYERVISEDATRCDDLGILYMPTMWPGFSWHNLKKNSSNNGGGGSSPPPPPPVNSIPRLGGRFMWAQAHRYTADETIKTIWMAQFDEVDEGTAIFKVAKDESEVPAEGDWLTLDADGESLPDDWYLRLCGKAQRMFAGTIPLTETIPILPVSPATTHPATFSPTKSPTASPVTDSRWYMDWNVLQCKRNCDDEGNLFYGGKTLKVRRRMRLFKTVQACCAKSFRRHPDLAGHCLDASLKNEGLAGEDNE